jgi:hypothetical protein
MPRTRLHAVPLTLAITLAVSIGGCAAIERLAPQGAATPTPAAVDSERAATAFTDTICAFNDGAFAFNETWTDLEAPLGDLHEAAALSRAEAVTAKEQLEDVAWPADIGDEITVIEGYLDERVGKLDQVLGADSAEQLDAIDFTTPDDVGTAASRIEERLGLGTDYCPTTAGPDPQQAGLTTSTWSGVDSDGDDTVIILGTDGDAQVTVGTTPYSGSWKLADGVLTLDVTTTDNALSFHGFYEAGQTSMSLSGTATNGHTWTVELRRL